MTQQQEYDEQAAVAATMSPGQMLRIARDQNGVQFEEAARGANLTPRIAQALEQDDYGALGLPVYARGYYRRYAKVVGCDATQLLAAYEEINNLPSPVPQINQRPSIPYGKNNELQKKLQPWLVAGAGLVVVVVWLLSRPATKAENPTFDDTAVDVPVAAVVVTPVPSLPALPDEGAMRNPVSVDLDQLDEATEASGVESQRLNTAKPADPMPQTATGTGGALPPNQLDIIVGPEPAWIEVWDAADNRLSFRVAEPGEHISLQGDPPYRLNLGRAHTLRVRFGGGEIDLRPLMDSASRARVTLSGRGELQQR